MNTKTLQQIIEDSVIDLPGLELALIGYIEQGMGIVYTNPANLNIESIAAYTSELIKSNIKFKDVLGQEAEIKYLITRTSKNRLMLQVIPKTEFYVAMVTKQDSSFEQSIPVFKKLLKESSKILLKKSQLSYS